MGRRRFADGHGLADSRLQPIPNRCVNGKPNEQCRELKSVTDRKVKAVLSPSDLLDHAADIAANNRAPMSEGFLDYQRRILPPD